MVNTDETSDDNHSVSNDSRRTFLKAAGASGAAALTGLAGCIGGSGGGSGGTPTINIITWEEYTDIARDIEDRLDVKIDIKKSTSSSEMFSTWNSGADEQYDIAIPNNNYVPKMMDAGLVDSVPKDTVSNYGDVYDQFKTFADNQFTDGGEMYGVPIRFGWYGYSYDSRAIPEDHEQSYDLLFEGQYKDTDLSGDIIMYDDHFKAISAAALYLGYRDAFEGERVTLSSDQLDKIKQTMIEQKDLLQGYIAADPTYIQSFQQGNFTVGQSGRNEIVEMWTNGTDWPRMAAPKEGSLAWFEAAVVSKKSENKEKAWQVINEYIAPELGANLAKAGYSPSCNPKTQENLSKEENEMYGSIAPSKLEEFIPFKAVDDDEAWQNVWNDIKAA